MIDIKKEKLLTLAEAAASLPKVSTKKTHLSTIWRWMREGVCGVRLDHVRLGRRVLTSQEALERFMHESAEAAPLPRGAHARRDPKPRTTAQRESAIAKAKKSLAANGVKVA